MLVAAEVVTRETSRAVPSRCASIARCFEVVLAVSRIITPALELATPFVIEPIRAVTVQEIELLTGNDTYWQTSPPVPDCARSVPPAEPCIWD